MRHPTRKLAALTLAAALALPMALPLACAIPVDAELSDIDADRAERFDEARSRALGEAMRSESAGDRAVIADLFAPAIEAIETIPDGNYRCRTLKLGGLLPLTIYDYFACTISGDGTRIDKISGSQRFSGTLMPIDGGLFYRGAQHYNDDPQNAYGDDPERNQVGCVAKLVDQDIYRLEMPFPLQESTHDVIELVPKR